MSLGVLIEFAGVAMMIGREVWHDLGVNAVAQFMILGAAISYAFAVIYGRRFRTMGISPMSTATGPVVASSLILLPLMMVVDQPWTPPVPSLPTIGALVGVAAISTALAYVLYFRILSTAGATGPGERHPSGGSVSRRGSDPTPFRRHCPDRLRPGGHRRKARESNPSRCL